MAQVFLSYSSRDDNHMRRLRGDLRAAGLSVWTDETGLEPGTPAWQDTIEREIERADSLVVILSPDAKQSEWVKRELDYADAFSVRVFPILVRGDKRTAIPIALIRAQWTDARQDYQQALQKLVNALHRYLSIQPAQAPRPAAPARPAGPHDAVAQRLVNALRVAASATEDEDRAVLVADYSQMLDIMVMHERGDKVWASMDLFLDLEGPELQQVALDNRALVESLGWTISIDEEGDMEIDVERVVKNDQQRRVLADDIITIFNQVFGTDPADLEID